MKKFYFFMLCSLAFLCSCSDENVTDVTSNSCLNASNDHDGVLNFSSRKMLIGAIEQEDGISRSSLNRQTEDGTFISLMDEITPNATCLNDLSKEEKDTILNQHLNYYEAFGYDNLVPNEQFAKLLNWKGEVLVNDSLYRITPVGTFCADNANKLASIEIERCYEQIVSKEHPVFKDEFCVKLNDNVCLYNSFPEYKLNESNCITRANSEIPLRYYSNESNGWVWRRLASLFGERSTKHFEYISKKRINGSLYDYNYGVYAESGAFVSASRKRGGFFRKINGWKDIDAQELDIVCKNMLFERDYKVPYTLVFPKNLQLSSNTNFIFTNLSDKPLKTIDLFGYEISAKALLGILKGSSKDIINVLNNRLNTKIANDTKAVRILTPTKCYTFLIESITRGYNCKKIRTVFNSSWQVYISNNIIANPISLKSVAEFFNNVRSIPVKHIASGRVILMSKIDNQWGGLVIDKNYSGGNGEHIYK